MKARRIGNGKGVEAIENVIDVTNTAIDCMMELDANHNELGELNPEFELVPVVVNVGIAHDTIEQFFADVASGVIDDGDVMDYIIESKNDSFMSGLEELLKLFAALVEQAGAVSTLE